MWNETPSAVKKKYSITPIHLEYITDSLANWRKKHFVKLENCDKHKILFCTFKKKGIHKILYVKQFLGKVITVLHTLDTIIRQKVEMVINIKVL